MILGCLHRFHPECIQKWFESQNKCPVCKQPVEVTDQEDDLTSVHNTHSSINLLNNNQEEVKQDIDNADQAIIETDPDQEAKELFSYVISQVKFHRNPL